MVDRVAGERRFPGWNVALLAGIVWMAADSVGRAAEEPAAGTDATAKPAPASYVRDVLPILQANCQGCHQPAKASGKLEMTAFKSLLAGGESGMPAIVPGKPDESYLIEQITPDRRRSGDAARQEAARRRRDRAHPPLDRRRRQRRHAARFDAAHRCRAPAHLQRPARHHVARLVARRRAAWPSPASTKCCCTKPTAAGSSPGWSACRSGSNRCASRPMARSWPSRAAGRRRWAKCRFGMSPIAQLLAVGSRHARLGVRRLLVARRQARRLWRHR